MAYIFNQGQFNEVVVTRACAGKLLGSNAYPPSSYTWPVESPVAFNIANIIQYYLDHSDQTFIPMFVVPDSVEYGFKIEPGPSAIDVHIAQRSGGIISRGEKIYYALNDDLLKPYYVYLLYAKPYQVADDTAFHTMLIYKDLTWIGTDIQIHTPNNRPALVGIEHGEEPLPVFPVYNKIYSGTDSIDAFDPDYYNSAPPIGFEGDPYMATDFVELFAQSPLIMTGTDNEGPEPYVPTPPIPEDPPFDPSEPTPYPVDPQRDDTSDEIPIPNMPPVGVTTAGFINVYTPGVNALQGLGDILFPQFSIPSDVVDAIYQLYNVIANQNLINYVIDCHVIPVSPVPGSNKNIKVGYRDTGISVPSVAYDYVDATCGSISLSEYFHSYADYAATVSKLYLPFIGFVDMKPEFWQGGTLSVDYKFNVIDGSFMCYVRSTSSKSQLAGSIIAQYSGNACMHLPLTGVNYAQMVSGIVGAVAGGITQGTASAIAGGAWSAVNTIARGGGVQQSNGYSSTAALLGVRKPYLMIERAVPAFPSKYGHDKGYPSNITTLLSNIRGYTEISDIDLTGLPFTQSEIEELRELLASGVYF